MRNIFLKMWNKIMKDISHIKELRAYIMHVLKSMQSLLLLHGINIFKDICGRTYGTPVAFTLVFQQSYSLYETNALSMHHKPFSFASYTAESMRRRCTNFIINTTANTLESMRRRCISFVIISTAKYKTVRRRCTTPLIHLSYQ